MTTLCTYALAVLSASPELSGPVEASEVACTVDASEPNDTPQQAARQEHVGRSWGSIQGFLCAGEDDWYVISSNTKELGLPSFYFQVDVVVAASDFCAGICTENLPPSPETTVFVEIYNSSGKQLIGEEIDEDGRLDLDIATHAKKLLVRVHGYPNVSYAYELGYVFKNKFGGEDECEC